MKMKITCFYMAMVCVIIALTFTYVHFINLALPTCIQVELPDELQDLTDRDCHIIGNILATHSIRTGKCVIVTNDWWKGAQGEVWSLDNDI